MAEPDDAAGGRFPAEVTRATLDNGLRAVAVPLPHLHTATITVVAKAGPRYETPASNGVSHLVEHMLFRGTPTHPTAFAMNRAIESLGGLLEGETHVDQTLYRVTLPPESLAPALSVLGEMFRAPVMEGLAVEKRIVREEILEQLDEDDQLVDVDEIARAGAFSPHPLGLSLTGSLDTVDALREADLRAHHAAHYGARNLVVSVAGRIDGAAALDAIGAGFGDQPPGAPVTTTPPPAVSAAPRLTCVESTGSQTDVRLVFRVPGERHRDALALHVLSRVLDDGLSSRLHREVSDARGLAYDAFCAVDLYDDAGLFDLGAAVEHGKTAEVAAVLRELVAGLATAPPDRDELDRVARRYVWSLEAVVDDAEAIGELYATRTLFDLPTDLGALASAVRALSPERLAEVARRHLDPAAGRLTAVGMLDARLRAALDPGSAGPPAAGV